MNFGRTKKKRGGYPWACDSRITRQHIYGQWKFTESNNMLAIIGEGLDHSRAGTAVAADLPH